MTNQKYLQKLVDKYGNQLNDRMKEPVFFINEVAGLGPANAKLNIYQEQWVREVHVNKLTNTTAFRSSGKTEAVGVCYPIFKAFTQPNWWGIVVSDKEEQAKEILSRIKNKIEQNAILRTSIPKHKNLTWSKTELTLSNGSRILAKPYTDRLRSWHVNWAMFDEAGEYRSLDVYEANAYSITQSRWELPGAGIHVTGTPKSELDLLHVLRKNVEFKSFIYPADMKWGNTGKTLWGIRYPRMTLAQKKKTINNNLQFSREFLCKVLSSGDELFPYGVVETAFDYDYGFDDRGIPEYIYFMGIDFALSGESGADFSAYAMYQKNTTTNVVRLVKLERYKGLSYGAQKLRIKHLNNLFRPQKIIADEGTFGKAFVQELRNAHLPIKGYKFQNKRQELLEVFRGAFDVNFKDERDINGNPIPVPFEERKFLINYMKGDLKCSKMIDELVKELLGFGVVLKTSRSGDMTGTIRFESVKLHDDLVMACALGYWACRTQQTGTFAISRGSSKPREIAMFST